MLSSGMLRRAVLVRTDMSEERSASIIRVTRIGGLVIVTAVKTSNLTFNFLVILNSRRSAKFTNPATVSVVHDCQKPLEDIIVHSHLLSSQIAIRSLTHSHSFPVSLLPNRNRSLTCRLIRTDEHSFLTQPHSHRNTEHRM
jgi:hypothetical protein